MRAVNNFVFIDEIESNFNQDPVIHYFCTVVIEREMSLIEGKVKWLIEPLGKRGFHAKRDYKNIEKSKGLMCAMNDLIIDNKLFCFCFSFRKSFLKNPRLKVLNEIVMKDWDVDYLKFWDRKIANKIASTTAWNLKADNYRHVATFLLIHCLNKYLSIQGYMKKYRLIFDEDVIKSNQIIIPKPDGVLNNIETIYGASMKDAPILCLSDHIGYIFGKAMRAKRLIDGKAIDKPRMETPLTRECIANLIDLTTRSQFVYKDIWDYISDEA